MAYLNITTSATNQLVGPPAKKVRITINNGWTGTVVLKEGITTGTANTVATITNPTTGNLYEYWDVGTSSQAAAQQGGAGTQNPAIGGTAAQASIWCTTTGTLGDVTINSATNMR